MQVKSVAASYCRTWNLGEYESMKVGATVEADVEPGESTEEAAAALFVLAKGIVKEQSLPVIEARDAKAARLAAEALGGLGK